MNTKQKQIELVARILREETTLSLATTGKDGQPCIAPLFYIVDDELSFYWLSSEDSLHSRNLLGMPSAAATVYRCAKSWREICGVQMRGEVAIVTDPKRREALVKIYCERFKLGRVFRLAIQRSVLFVLQPEFFRFIDNAKGFGDRFELARPPQGWNTYSFEL